MTGRGAIGRLAVETATYRFLERAPGNGRASIGSMHIHACAVAACALELANRSGSALELAHLGGLLHDIGKLVMPIAFGEEAMDEIASQALAGPERVELERDRLGCDHALAGALLARASYLDEPVVAAIAAHHDPATGPTPELACVQLGNAIVGMLGGVDADPLLVDHALAALELDATVLDDVAAHAAPRAGSAPSLSPAADGLAARVAALEEQAGSDELTGLANRRRWKREAKDRILAEGGAVMICDIDHFKQINDRSGHLTGDLVLSEIARILSHHGFAGRLGGDELVLLAGAGSGARRGNWPSASSPESVKRSRPTPLPAGTAACRSGSRSPRPPSATSAPSSERRTRHCTKPSEKDAVGSRSHRLRSFDRVRISASRAPARCGRGCSRSRARCIQRRAGWARSAAVCPPPGLPRRHGAPR